MEYIDICKLIKNTKESLPLDLQHEEMTVLGVEITGQPPEEQVASDFVRASRRLCYILLLCPRLGRLMSRIARLEASDGSALAKLAS